jgi:type VII secretion protein EccE
MAAELAALAVGVAVLVDDPAVRAGAAVFAAVLVVAVSARLGGRWWLTHLPRRAALRSRRQAASDAVAKAARSGDPRLVALASVAPGAAVREYRDRGSALGIGQDEGGWYCALVVAPWSSLDGTRRAAFTLDRLTRVFTETSVPVSAVQVVNCVMPAPTGLIPANSPLAQSYRDLLGADPVQADQAVWVALRLNPRDAADAAASRGGGLDGVDRALATSIARIGKALSEVDASYRILDGAELLDAVSGAVGGSGAVAAERWQLWHATGLSQVCYEVADWPTSRPADFLAGFSRLPAALVSVAVQLRPTDGEVGLRGLIRVGAQPGEIGRTGRAVEDMARRAGGKVRRLDGEHGPAVYATCPTGGIA